jgi:hypothetical protein
MEILRLKKLAGLLTEAAFTNLERGKTKKGKDIVFFPTTAQFKKAIMAYLPSETKISLKTVSFSSLGYGSSIAANFTLNGKALPSMGSPETFQPFQPLFDGVSKFLEDLGGGDISIGIGTQDDYSVVTGIPNRK